MRPTSIIGEHRRPPPSLVSKASQTSRESSSAAVVDPSEWVRWQDVNKLEDGEAAKQEALVVAVSKLMDLNFAKHLRYMRAAHVKSHAFVRGTLTVSSNLPTHLRHGLFASPGAAFTAVGRYSSEANHLEDDKLRGVRGFAVKVLGVSGARVSGGDFGAQDLLFNNCRTSELYSLDAAVDVFRLKVQYFDDADGLELALRSRLDAEKMLTTAHLLENTHLIANKLYMQAPIRYGPYVAKLSLLPATPAQLAIAAKARQLPNDADSTAHRKLLRAYFHSYHATYIIRAQFAAYTRQYSISDTSIPWDVPWVELGRLDLPIQESYSDQRRVWFEDTLALSPWNALRAHEPVGALGRARRAAYEASQRIRADRNVSRVSLDVAGPESIPD